jgi:hypothetical protein
VHASDGDVYGGYTVFEFKEYLSGIDEFIFWITKDMDRHLINYEKKII